MSGQGAGGKTAAEMRAQHEAMVDSSPMTTRCAFCQWTYEGTAHEGRELAAGHRRVHHPEAKQTRRRRGSLNRFTLRDDGFREEGLERAKVVAAALERLEATG